MIKKIGDILREFLSEKGWPSDDPASAVFLKWAEIVGEDIGSHSRPVEIEKNVLIVVAEHPGWVQLIGLRKKELLRTLQSAAPHAGINDLRVRLQRGA